MRLNLKDEIEYLRDYGCKKLYVGVNRSVAVLAGHGSDLSFRTVGDLEKYDYVTEVDTLCCGKGNDSYLYVFLDEGWDEI